MVCFAELEEGLFNLCGRCARLQLECCIVVIEAEDTRCMKEVDPRP